MRALVSERLHTPERAAPDQQCDEHLKPECPLRHPLGQVASQFFMKPISSGTLKGQALGFSQQKQSLTASSRS